MGARLGSMGGCGETGRRSRLKICFPYGSAGSSPAIRTIAAATAIVALQACTPADDPNRVDVSIIGPAPRLGDPDREALDASRSILLRETAMGLVTLDASGQIEPALAESWIVTDDGRSIIFRIHRVRWPDGSEVTGDEVAQSINRALAANSQNRLKPLLSAIDAVIGMTGRVVEVRLKVPRPYLLQLLAQPELGIRRKGAGLGPWRITGRGGGALTLRPAPDIASEGLEDAPRDLREVRVSGGRAALAIARFAAGRNDLVMGGTLADWPLVRAAALDGTNRIRRDPVDGLFGLAIMPQSAFLKERTLREALSMAIDRSALDGGLDLPRWTAMDRLLPAQLDSGQAAVAPDWLGNSIDERRSIARDRIAGWVRGRGKLSPLRVALPKGPGMRILFAHLAADWRRIGVDAVTVSLADDAADMRLIDEVSPNTSANWYLTRTGCDYGLACSVPGDLALREARAAPTLGQRSAAIARADAAFAANSGYIPLGKPVRWSLVGAALTRYRDNAMATHPFAELRERSKN